MNYSWLQTKKNDETLCEITKEQCANRVYDAIYIKHSKLTLSNYFREWVAFVQRKQKFKAEIFYSTNTDNFILAAYEHNCATELNESIGTIDFGLNDRFCDKADLRSSGDAICMPEPFITFFPKLFDIDSKLSLDKKTTYVEPIRRT